LEFDIYYASLSFSLQTLTSISLCNLWLTYHASSLGNMMVSIHLPTVSIMDLRPGLPLEQALVLSTTASSQSAPAAAAAATAGAWEHEGSSSSSSLPPSLIVMEYRSFSALGAGSTVSWAPMQALRVRLQRPTLVLEFPFLIAVLNFVSPQPVLQGALPVQFQSRELSLGSEIHYAKVVPADSTSVSKKF
jgi:vacuolar protein sorting-associated protein 13A/C